MSRAWQTCIRPVRARYISLDARRIVASARNRRHETTLSTLPPSPCSEQRVFHIVLFEPEIPPNTGNAIRLSANAGAKLHLIEPLGFEVSEKSLRRAGLDYHKLAHMQIWSSLDAFFTAVAPPRWFAVSTRGTTRYDSVRYQAGDALVFGPETRGLPAEVLERCPAAQRLRVPMVPGNRSLNLSNTVAVLVYEAWRQHDFGGGS